MNANVFKKIDEDNLTSQRVLGCAFEVGKVLGPGSLEVRVRERFVCRTGRMRTLAEYYSAYLRPFAFIRGKKENIE